ncbi:MAG: hypothetical protein HPY52_15910 [Firmicutes bacterium]|nr:hypothetical protein [Bacillota bacterium]
MHGRSLARKENALSREIDLELEAFPGARKLFKSGQWQKAAGLFETAHGALVELMIHKQVLEDEGRMIATARARYEGAQKAAAEAGQLEQEIESLMGLLQQKRRRRDLLLAQTNIPGLNAGSPGLNGEDPGLEKEQMRQVNEIYEALQREWHEIEETPSYQPNRQLDPDEALQEKSRLEEELRRLEDKRAKMLQTDQLAPAMWVDKPIRRFLQYGGHMAEDFILHTVELLDSSCRAGQPELPDRWPDSYRYKRIWDAFKKWWSDGGHELCSLEADRAPRPRFVSWKQSGEWLVGVRIPDRLLADPALRVDHDERKLAESPGRFGCWPIPHLDGTVVIRWGEGKEANLDIRSFRQAGEPCYIFWGWDGQAKPLPLCQKIGRASKLTVIAPGEWRVDEEDAIQFAGKEPCSIPGFMAYFFNLDQDRKNITFRKPSGQTVTLAGTEPQNFELLGSRPSWDRDHEMGPLFVAAPPSLRCLDEGALALASFAEIAPGGRQLPVSRRWLSEGVQLPLEGMGGCFWTVVYDICQNELARLAFRYAPGLRQVRIMPDPVPIFPGTDGHPAVTICFDIEPGSRIEWAGARQGNRPSLRHDRNTTIAELPAIPQYDITEEWRLCSQQGEPVPIRITLERVWWAAGLCGQIPADSDWTDQVIRFEKSWFHPASQEALWVRVPPMAGQVQQVQAGFSGDKRRSYNLRKHRYVEIPLREFADSEEILNDRHCQLQIWLVSRDGGELAAGSIGIYAPDTPGHAKHTEGAGEPKRAEHEERVDEPELTPVCADDPEYHKTCSTCDFARRYMIFYYCSRKQWGIPQSIQQAQFERERASYYCPKWQGEYRDASGQWVSED